MPLLLNQQDLRPLLTSETFYTDLFQVIRDALLRQKANEPGVVSWLAFPTTQEQDIVLYEQSGSFAWDGAILRWLYEWAVKQRVGTSFTLSSPPEGEKHD